MELKQIATIVIVILILLLIIILVIYPVIESGTGIGGEVEFREFCVFWAGRNYRGSAGDEILVGDTNVNIGVICGEAVGLLMPASTEEQIQSCRDKCKFYEPPVSQ